MLKYLVGWFSSTDAELQNTVLCIPQSVNCHLSRTIFGIYISHTKPGLANKDRARVVSSPQSPLNLLHRSVSFYLRLFVPLLLAAVHSSFHLRRKMLLLVLRADLHSFTVPVHVLGFTALFQLVHCCFIIVQGHLV